MHSALQRWRQKYAKLINDVVKTDFFLHFPVFPLDLWALFNCNFSSLYGNFCLPIVLKFWVSLLLGVSVLFWLSGYNSRVRNNESLNSDSFPSQIGSFFNSLKTTPFEIDMFIICRTDWWMISVFIKCMKLLFYCGLQPPLVLPCLSIYPENDFQQRQPIYFLFCSWSVPLSNHRPCVPLWPLISKMYRYQINKTLKIDFLQESQLFF